jgi:hypothetical protein
MKKKIRCVLSSIWYPMAMATWFWRAFERRKDIDLQIVGPFTGDYIPWNYGMRLPQKYIRTPDVPLPQQTIQQSIPASVVEHQLPWIPDIFIQIDAGFHYSTRPNAGVVVHVQTDPHVLKNLYTLPKSYSDINFCMQLCYSEPGEIYLPYAADETVHYPMDVDKIYDACLIGLQYPTRNSLVDRLRSHGLNVKYTTGEIFDEYRLSYNQSKIALNWSTLDDIPARFFEGMAMNLPLVSNIVPDIEKLGFIEGTDYFGFRSLDEADNKVKQLLVDEGLRCWVAENGHKKVMEKHLWRHRVEQILKQTNLI